MLEYIYSILLIMEILTMTLTNFEQLTLAQLTPDQRELLTKDNRSFYPNLTVLDKLIKTADGKPHLLIQRVLAYIAFKANKVTGKWKSSYTYLAEKHQCTKAYIVKIIRAGKEGGLITTTLEKGNQMFVTFTPFGRACFSMLFDLEEKMLFDSKEKTGKK